MTPLRILVVDDDVELLRVTGDVLAAAGYDIMRASCGSEATALINEEHVDCVLLDMMLGAESGLDVMAEMKGISPLTEVIIATGYASVE